MSDGISSTVSNVLSDSVEKASALSETAAAVIQATEKMSTTSPPDAGITSAFVSDSHWNTSTTEFSSSFLEHASGQGISGACAWAAILITCHQVSYLFFYK